MIVGAASVVALQLGLSGPALSPATPPVATVTGAAADDGTVAPQNQLPAQRDGGAARTRGGEGGGGNGGRGNGGGGRGGR